MTQLYVNGSLDWLIVNASNDWLLVGDSTTVPPPESFPLYPTPKEISIRSYAPAFVSVTHGLNRQSRSRGGQVWQLELRYAAMTRAQSAAFWAFLNSQSGQAKRWTINITGYFANRGAGGGTPRVNGGGQSGTSLITDGWPNSTAILKAGDLITIENDRKVYQIVSDVSSNGSGQATLTIYPALRYVPSDNFTIDFTPEFYVTLTSDVTVIDWTQCQYAEGLTLELVEVLV